MICTKLVTVFFLGSPSCMKIPLHIRRIQFFFHEAEPKSFQEDSCLCLDFSGTKKPILRLHWSYDSWNAIIDFHLPKHLMMKHLKHVVSQVLVKHLILIFWAVTPPKLWKQQSHRFASSPEWPHQVDWADSPASLRSRVWAWTLWSWHAVSLCTGTGEAQLHHSLPAHGTQWTEGEVLGLDSQLMQKKTILLQWLQIMIEHGSFSGPAIAGNVVHHPCNRHEGFPSIHIKCHYFQVAFDEPRNAVSQGLRRSWHNRAGLSRFLKQCVSEFFF